MAPCNIFNKRVLAHALTLQCNNCKDLVHLKCLPQVSREDSIYTDRATNNWFCMMCVQCIFPYNHFDDENTFMQELSNHWVSGTMMSYESIKGQNKLFIPFDLNEKDNHPLHDVDPDVQYYQVTCNDVLNTCDYHLEESFNRNISRLNIISDNFSIIHANIRSIPKNLATFECYLQTLEHDFSIIGFSESWLKESNANLFHIDAYKTEHNYRTQRAGGGVSLFIKESIEYYVRPDMSQ